MMIQVRRSIKYSVEATIGLMLLLVIVTMLSGCEDKETEGEFKVAMLLPASKSDAGWNALAYSGLLLIEKELGAKIMDVESRTYSEQVQHFRFYAEKGYDLIIGHGYEYQKPAKAVASDYPDTIFFTSSGGTITDNILAANFRVEQPAYLLGIIAGMMTQGNKIGCIGGQEIPSVKSTFMAFEDGARSVNPDIVVIESWIGNWTDANAGKLYSEAQIDQGVDFIFPNADAAGLGAYEAAENAQAEGKTVYTFGANLDKSNISPKTILANAVVTPDVFVQIAKVIKDGKFEKHVYTFNMLTDNAITFTYNPAMKDKIPQNVLDKVEEAKSKILSGKLEPKQIDFTEEN